MVVARRAFKMLPFLLWPPAAMAADEEADFGPAPAMEALLKLDMVSSIFVSVREYRYGIVVAS